MQGGYSNPAEECIILLTIDNMLKGLFLDFGGVIADEGYKESLFLFADKFGIERERFFQKCADLIYETGYIIGKSNQKIYFAEIKKSFNIEFDDFEFEKTILGSFRIRKNILDIVERVRQKGIITAILSDQTDWLDKINEKYNFFKDFNFVFNSYHIGMGKRGKEIFNYVAKETNLKTSEILFIDDQMQNIERARQTGIKGICLTDEKDILQLIINTFLSPSKDQ